MAGHNYFFLKLAGQYTNNTLLGAGLGGSFPLSTGGGVFQNFFWTFECKMARFGAFRVLFLHTAVI